MDNTEALEAFEAIMAEAMATVKQHGGKHGVYLNDLASKVRNHLTDPCYVRVPEGQHLMPSAFLQEYLGLLEQSDFKEIHKLVRRKMVEAMLAATGDVP